MLSMKPQKPVKPEKPKTRVTVSHTFYAYDGCSVKNILDSLPGINPENILLSKGFEGEVNFYGQQEVDLSEERIAKNRAKYEKDLVKYQKKLDLYKKAMVKWEKSEETRLIKELGEIQARITAIKASKSK